MIRHVLLPLLVVLLACSGGGQHHDEDRIAAAGNGSSKTSQKKGSTSTSDVTLPDQSAAQETGGSPEAALDMSVIGEAGKSIAITIPLKGKGVTIALLTRPRYGSLDGTGPAFTYTPQSDFSGSDQFTFAYRLDGVRGLSATVTIEVQKKNAIPELSLIGEHTAEVGEAYEGKLLALDRDGKPPSLKVLRLPAWLTMAPDGALSGIPHVEHISGSAECAFEASDGTEKATLTTEIRVVNAEPPEEPRRFVGIAGDSSVAFTWENPTEEDFALVRLVRLESTTAKDGPEIYAGRGEMFEDTTAVNGKTYVYRIHAEDSAGNISLATTISVTPRALHQLSILVEGLDGEGLLLKHDDEQLSITASGSYSFAGQIEDGDHYVVSVAKQPQSPRQLCVFDEAAGEGYAHEDVQLRLVCVVVGDGLLVINELGNTSFANMPVWVELYNPSAVAVDLADYKLRSLAIDPGGGDLSDVPVLFALPARLIPPGAYILVRGAVDAFRAAYTGEAQVFIRSEGDDVPFWASDGFLELRDKSGETVDFVSFGEDIHTPATSGHWDTGNGPSLPSAGEESYGYSIGRDGTSSDTDSAADWLSYDFSTPGGPNDAACNTDNDEDGIPDCSEQLGSTFAGLPLYDWGARQGVRDVFIEIDYMQSASVNLTPRLAALEKVAEVFAGREIALHLDFALAENGATGAVRSLGGSGEVPHASVLSYEQRGADIANVYDLKGVHFDPARRQIFHYAVFGDLLPSSGDGTTLGLAEMYGNDIALGLGALPNLGYDTEMAVTNAHALVFMHEFGHNLGLDHGGGDEFNFKPNYLSIMNYLYGKGLPALGASEGDRYYYETNRAGGDCDLIVDPRDLGNGPFGDIDDFRIDFSDGFAAAIDEQEVSEQGGLGRGTGSVDYNCDGNISASSYALDLNADDDMTLLEDFDDWGNLSFFFQRYLTGENFLTRGNPVFRDPVFHDRQRVVP